VPEIQGESDTAILHEALYYVQCTQFQFVDSMLLMVRLDEHFFQVLSENVSSKDGSPLKKLARTPMYLKAAHMLMYCSRCHWCCA